ncbi:unnamed protein product [Dovyalis caffra]|uniref:Uncharacterized protein n=1 Tax=Dovyalis caffra TaxID=77055 RepID=A0AAV1R8D5_9ROSI|nr:unnamed protein product [Dovyalis caffra]
METLMAKVPNQTRASKSKDEALSPEKMGFNFCMHENVGVLEDEDDDDVAIIAANKNSNIK